MATPQTLLQLLQTRTIVDCDTMDVECPKALGPFVDCTSNQAIAYFQLQKTPPDALKLKETLSLLRSPEIPDAELAVEIAMVSLQLEISKYVTGFVHVQVNPYYSYSSSKIISNSHRIVKIFQTLDKTFDTKRICIKIPSTWEGLLACRTLEASSPPIATLATTLFTLEQAALAGRFVDPFVAQALALCLDFQNYYKANAVSTQVLPASLTSTDEVMALAGVHHITIAPSLLQLLASMPATEIPPSVFDGLRLEPGTFPLLSFVQDEAAYRIAFTRSGNGEGERKLR
ncbi:hypothetical protein B0O99DRAFT_610389 [Bisporella sp. PMI_857]|nr:hypothetical protein B0O99DRAFT_612817 [Bisporella sp. PMI_857]KAH8600302.1 hypothetical protein B0O99DRAFT_610389 [Bisporella sp. PMI_857]